MINNIDDLIRNVLYMQINGMIEEKVNEISKRYMRHYGDLSDWKSVVEYFNKRIHQSADDILFKLQSEWEISSTMIEHTALKNIDQEIEALSCKAVTDFIKSPNTYHYVAIDENGKKLSSILSEVIMFQMERTNQFLKNNLLKENLIPKERILKEKYGIDVSKY